MKKQSAPEEATIRDVTTEGKGVVGGDGKAIFISGALTGEKVVFQRYKKRRKYDEGDLLEVLEASPDRVDPKCPHFLNCGGCTWQHLAADKQILMKQDALLQAFERIGGVAANEVMPPLTGESWGYRRRARFGAKYVDKKERALVGFRERIKPFIADMDSCETVDPKLGALLPKLQDLVGSLSICRRVPQIEASVGEAETSLVFRVLDEPSAADVAALAEFEKAEQVTVLLQRKGLDTITKLQTQEPPDKLFYTLPEFDVRIEFGPVDFIQVNHEINQKMISQAIDWAQPKETDRVLDLFCGLGNFSLPLARKTAHVTGVEGEARSVQGAKANAEINGITNTEFYVANLFDTDVLEDTQQNPWLKGDYDLVLLDPPRAGAAEMIPALRKLGAEKILYVSCHPGTLARDAKSIVEELGYTLVRAGVIDMFPQTGHVESMALFVKGS